MNWFYEKILGFFYNMEKEEVKVYDPMWLWDNSGNRIEKALENPNFSELYWQRDIKISGIAPYDKQFERIKEFIQSCGKVQWIHLMEEVEPEKRKIKYFLPFECIMKCDSKESMDKILHSVWLSDLWVDDGIKMYLCV